VKEQQQKKKKDEGNTTKEDELDEEEGRRSQSPSNAPRDREEDGELQRIFESLNPEQRERVVGSFGCGRSSSAGQGAEMQDMRERLEAEHAAALVEYATALAEKDSALAEHATALAKEKSRCHALAEEQKHALAELAAARKHAHAATNSHDDSTHDDVARVAETIFEGSTQRQHQLEKHAGKGEADDTPAPPPGPPPSSPPVIA
jgi:hypothetical protein